VAARPHRSSKNVPSRLTVAWPAFCIALTQVGIAMLWRVVMALLLLTVVGCGGETGRRINSNLDKPMPPKAIPKT
jgi:hypothetical protein